MKLWPSSTPRLTTDGNAGYCTLSAGQGTKVQMKNTPGCQLQNSNTLKNSYQTSMPNTMETWSPPDLNPPLPHHLTLILLSRKHHSPSIPLCFHSSPHHPTLTIPQYNKPHALQQHPRSLPTSPNITTKTLPTIPFIPFHSFPHLLTLTTLNNKTHATPKHSHSPHISDTHNLQHSCNSESFHSLPTTPTLTLLHKKK
jgi:hypothetical protein